MGTDPQESVRYKRSRFSTRLPAERLYTASHFWLESQTPEVWRVGFTKFATRMLGELVEYGFEVKTGDTVQVGQIIGWVEGFKAASDLFCVVAGEFQGENPDLESDVGLVQSDPYGKGWLYRVKGTPEADSVDVHGYVAILDATITKIQGSQE